MTLYCQTDGPFGEVYRYGTLSVLQDLGERGQWLTVRHPELEDRRDSVNLLLWEATPENTAKRWTGFGGFAECGNGGETGPAVPDDYLEAL